MKISALGSLACALCTAFSLSFAHPQNAKGEGFALMEYSARGMGLAGAMVARGGDPSSVAYNPAAITLLPGTQLQGNLAISQFYWGVDTRVNGTTTNSHSSHQTWPLPSIYVTHQLNDKFWIGVGMYTRFGLGVKYPHNWPGGTNLQSVQLITSSFNPNIAWKINDIFSVAIGAEIMYADMQLRKDIYSTDYKMFIGDSNINGHGASFGGNIAMHAKINEHWSFGLTYRAPMSLKVNGKARWDPMLARYVSHTSKNTLHGTMHLPDSFNFGVAWTPIKELSIEADATYTLWSRFRDFNMYMEGPMNTWVNSDKHWRNSWSFSLSVEYKVLEWLALRAGTMYEKSPQNYGNSDYMVPSNGRNYYTVGAGIYYGNWVFDFAYMYIRNRVLDYTSSANHGTTGVLPGKTTHPHAHNFGVGITYKF